MRFRAIVLAVIVVGCARRPAIPPATTPAETAAARDAGKVAFRFLVDPGAMTSVTAKVEELVSPRPTADLPLPNYPEAALAAQAGAAHVVVRILIDTDGRIQDVTDSPVASSSSGPFSGEFRDAVLRALRHWRFIPGHFDHYEDGPDSDGDGKPDYRRLVRSERVPVRYDVRFDFEVIGGEGRVRTTATGQ
jgi:TonB family protein